MIVKKEMLDQPILLIISDLQVMIIEDMIYPAFQEILDTDAGRLQYSFFGGPEAKKCQYRI